MPQKQSIKIDNLQAGVGEKIFDFVNITDRLGTISQLPVGIINGAGWSAIGGENKASGKLASAAAISGVDFDWLNQFGLTTVASTIKRYTGPQLPTVTVSMFIVSYDNNSASSVHDAIRGLYRGVMPEGQGQSIFSFAISKNGNNPNANALKAPLGYNPASPNKNTITVQVGNTFTATNLLMSSSNIVPSLELNSECKPLYATVDVTLTPSTALYHADLMKWYGIK